MEPVQKFRVGPFEGWLVGKQQWEVRRDGKVLETARNMSDCCRAAERLYRESKEEPTTCP